MSDLISRQAALEMLNDNELERQTDDVFDGDLHRYKRAAQRIIAQLPTIDAVSVVRCKVCKHRPTKRMGRSGRYLDFPDYKCPFQCDDPWYNREPPDDWFCPKGEKGAKNETD